MINFVEGQINIGEKNILAFSNENLKALAEEGLIEKREIGGGRIYYYVEAQADNMRFGVFISLREKKIDWLRLSWLDSPVKGWDDASEDTMKNEYRLLSNFVEKTVGSPPDNKGNRKRTWRFKWGDVEVSYEPRAYQADIYMKPQ
ncbi:hypothetical protein [Massilia sp. ST3]|uniref:hypothetical protein n=1 Tax=Massilia sp. ST3 TaxID=2824903 RepID=UPI001B82082F|nr:hypothetical protein [Massilia sp. ST3]MBQ5949682.1 hypothetical protein [Massilia sp. ST3]